MCLVSIHNEWDRLEEVIVGRVDNARIPIADISLHAIEYEHHALAELIPSGPFPKKVIEETFEDLEILCDQLKKLGIVVRRPNIFDHNMVVQTPYWSTNGFYNYCPRDVFVTVGNTIIEAPMTLRSRQFESLSYKDHLVEYMKSGASWVSAPKPVLEDKSYDVTAPAGNRLLDLEPIFDAANTLRIGKDILYLVSDSGNALGCKWLQNFLGKSYTVHPMKNLYAKTHIDSTIMVLRPGLVLLNPSRVDKNNCPLIFKKWDKIWCPNMIDVGYTTEPYSSEWIGMNLLMIDLDIAIVEKVQKPLINALEKHKINVIPLSLRHSRTLGGGFHCVTLDIRRKGQLEQYD
jgi:glycine amidinotransferase/scyllo-inosamine-4-phosphate amidinotransferase 1